MDDTQPDEPIGDVVVLVDWDNVSSVARINSDADADHAVHEVKTLVVPLLQQHFASATRVEVRMYRAFEFETGKAVRWAVFLRAAATRAREHIGSMYFTFECADRLLLESKLRDRPKLAPFLQREACRCSHRDPINVQKLVDSMIVVDAASYGPFVGFGIIVISDDVDLAPGVLLAADQRRMMHGDPRRSILWVRPGAGATGIATRLREHCLVV